ncbi:MAG: hypothetical protein Q4Q00_13985 [Turicibacter sp.]|nr:hypothetical protein [Turicibacter sp.]
MIRLVSIDSTNFKECLALKVGENQQSFVCSNSDSLARAYVYYDLAYPFAIYEEKVMIGLHYYVRILMIKAIFFGNI